MPSPIAHAITGYALSRVTVTKHNRSLRSTPFLSLYAVFVACSPDLDFIPQLITNIRFHRGPSHSLLAALLVSGLLAWILNAYRKTVHQALLPYKPLFTFTLCLYLTHLALDLLTQGGSGIPLFWPLSTQNVQLPLAPFPPVHHSRGLFDPSHLIFVGAELLYAVALMAGLRWFKSPRSGAAN